MLNQRLMPGNGDTMWKNGSDVNLIDTLEDFFEVNEVGIDAVSNWKEEDLDEVSYYDLLRWYKIDRFNAEPANENHEHLTRIEPVFLKVGSDFFRSIYWSWGGNFRYDIPV